MIMSTNNNTTAVSSDRTYGLFRGVLGNQERE